MGSCQRQLYHPRGRVAYGPATRVEPAAVLVKVGNLGVRAAIWGCGESRPNIQMLHEDCAQRSRRSMRWLRSADRCPANQPKPGSAASNPCWN